METIKRLTFAVALLALCGCGGFLGTIKTLVTDLMVEELHFHGVKFAGPVVRRDTGDRTVYGLFRDEYTHDLVCFRFLSGDGEKVENADTITIKYHADSLVEHVDSVDCYSAIGFNVNAGKQEMERRALYDSPVAMSATVRQLHGKNDSIRLFFPETESWLRTLRGPDADYLCPTAMMADADLYCE